MEVNHYTFEELEAGHAESFTVTVTEEMMGRFCEITGDVNPLHREEEFAKRKGYGSTVVYGMLTASFLSTLAGVYLPGEHSLIRSVETKFVKPVFPGDTLTVTGTVTEKDERFALITVKVLICVVTDINVRGEKVLKGTMKIAMLDE